jgi:hypothetical protein
MKNALLVLLISLPVTACGSLGVVHDPVSGEPNVVNTATGEVVVPIMDTIETVGNTAGNLIGVPALGMILAAAASVFLTKKAKKPAAT